MKAILLLMLCIPFVCFSQQIDTRGVALTADKTQATGETYAIVIGISNYKEVTSLKYSDRDARIFADYLVNKKGLALDSTHVKVFLNDKATLYNIGNALSDIMVKQYKQGDQIIFFFAGHGDYDANILKDQALLLLYGAPKQNYFQNVFTGDFISTADLNSRFVEPMTAKGCRVMLIIDACHATGLNKELSGGTEGGKITAMALQNMVSPVKLYSCMATETSLESEQWGGGRGLFSYVLMEGLYGMADGDKNNVVSFKELQRYLEDNVPVLAAPNKQNPIARAEDPSMAVANVNSELLTAYLKEKENEKMIFARVNLKGDLDDMLKGMDSVQQQLYKQCDSLVESNELDAAFETFLKFAAVDSTSDLSLQLRRNLSVALQVHAGDILTPLLETVDKRSSDLSDVMTASRNLEKASSLLGEAHFFHKNLRARILFLKGLSQLLTIQTTKGFYVFSKTDSAAITNMEEAVEMEPNAAYTYYYLGKYYNYLNNFEKAKYFTKKYYDLIPKSFFACNTLGLVYRALKEYDEAINIFNKAIELKPDGSAIYVNLGSVYEAMGNNEEAIKCYRKAIEINPGFVGGYASLADLLFNTKSYEEAKTTYLKAIEIKANFGGPLFNLGCIYAYEKDTANAMIYIEKALEKRYSSLRTIQIEPLLNSIRELPEFKTMLEKYFTTEQLDKYPKLFIIQQ